jgi:hypothetical protein
VSCDVAALQSRSFTTCSPDGDDEAGASAADAGEMLGSGSHVLHAPQAAIGHDVVIDVHGEPA